MSLSSFVALQNLLSHCGKRVFDQRIAETQEKPEKGESKYDECPLGTGSLIGNDYGINNGEDWGILTYLNSRLLHLLGQFFINRTGGGQFGFQTTQFVFKES